MSSPLADEVSRPSAGSTAWPAVRRWSGLPIVAEALHVRRSAGTTLLAAAASAGRSVRPVAPMVLTAGGRGVASGDGGASSSWSGAVATRAAGASTVLPRAAARASATVPARAAGTSSTGIGGPVGAASLVRQGSSSNRAPLGAARLPAAHRYATFRRLVDDGPGSPDGSDDATRDGRHGLGPARAPRTGRRGRRGAVLGPAPVLGGHRGAVGAVLGGHRAATDLVGPSVASSGRGTSRPVLGLHRGVEASVELPGVTGAAGRSVLPPRAVPGTPAATQGFDAPAPRTPALPAAVEAALQTRLGGSAEVSRGTAGGSSGAVPARVAALLAAEASGMFDGHGATGTAPGALTDLAVAGGMPLGFPSPGLPSSMRTSEGAAMTVAPISRSWSDPAEPVAAALSPEVLDDLVDRVVERIEDRVVEELERRGRRAMPGVF